MFRSQGTKMNKFLLLSLLVASANCFYIDNGETQKDKIHGGDYSPIEAVPYLAQILYNDIQKCGGTIISEYWILSAAHCYEKINNIVVTVITGSNRMEYGQQREVAEIIVHPQYNPKTVENDIALVKLTKPIKFNAKQKPIAITTTPPKAGQNIVISGFGRVSEGGPDSPRLKAALAPVISQKDCQKGYEDGDITENMFCAGKGVTDSCEGDSGGPAVINNKLVGIVSWGYECGSPESPGVYTQLFRYRQWVAKNTGLKL